MRKICIILWLGLLQIWMTPMAYACSCANTERLSETVERTPVIFQGEVLKVSKPFFRSYQDHVSVKFKVEKIYKGQKVEKIEYVMVPIGGAASCGMRFRKGNRAMIFANASKNSTQLFTSACSKGFIFTDEDYVKYLETGEDTVNQGMIERRERREFRKNLHVWEWLNPLKACTRKTRPLTEYITVFKRDYPEDVKRAQSLSAEQLYTLSTGYLRSFRRGRDKRQGAGLTYLSMAADLGFDAAQHDLGTKLTRCGAFISLDLNLGVKYLEESAKQGHSKAKQDLVSIYAVGYEGVANPEIAKAYLRECTNDGNKWCETQSEIAERRKAIDLEGDTEFAKYYRRVILPQLDEMRDIARDSNASK